MKLIISVQIHCIEMDLVCISSLIACCTILISANWKLPLGFSDRLVFPDFLGMNVSWLFVSETLIVIMKYYYLFYLVVIEFIDKE